MTTDPRLVALRDIFRSWRETHCTKCGRPLASDADWKTFEEGEGEHLCWDGSDTCNLVMDADLSFAAEVEAHVQTRIAEFVDRIDREWRGGSGHTDNNRWVSIADLRAAAAHRPEGGQ